jgi:hypothetical protein
VSVRRANYASSPSFDQGGSPQRETRREKLAWAGLSLAKRCVSRVHQNVMALAMRPAKTRRASTHQLSLRHRTTKPQTAVSANIARVVLLTTPDPSLTFRPASKRLRNACSGSNGWCSPDISSAYHGFSGAFAKGTIAKSNRGAFCHQCHIPNNPYLLNNRPERQGSNTPAGWSPGEATGRLDAVSRRARVQRRRLGQLR